jgi:DNA-binding SARP family transcriptional activator/tetratricopeptide (TPR) repeat protein
MHPDSVRLFGRPELHDAGRRTYLVASQLHRFVAYLAVRADWVSRDEAVFLFWPDRVDAVGRRNLRKLLHRARRVVDGIEVARDRFRWLVASDLGASRDALGVDAAAALELVRGPLLEGLDAGAPSEFAGWLDRQRERFRAELVDGVVARCAQLEGSDAGAAADLSLALVRTDPLDERAVLCGLRSLAAAGRIDAAERVYATYARDLAAELGVEPDGPVRALHRALLAARGATPDPARPAPRRPLARTRPVPWGTTSFLGRRAELTELDERLASALAGDGGIVVVEGEAGVGKTRLVETFLASLPDGVKAFAGRCYERDLSAPLEPVRAALGVLGAAELAHAPDAARFAAAEPRDRGHVHRALTARLLQAAARGRGAVLFVDDLQWSDAATLEFLAYAAHRVRGERVLIVVSHRREDRTGLEHWKAQLSERRAIRSLRLGRFEAGHTHGLVAEVLGGSGADLECFAAFVHDESEGNPFYALEYLRWLRDTRQLEGDAARPVTAPSRERLASTAVPESIRSLIWARYRGFGEGARTVLDAAAVIGRSFAFDVLERVVGGGPETVWATFEPLIAAGLIVAGADGSYAFSHDKLRQTVYESLGPPGRRALHARVARELEADGAADADLAHHFLRAELWPQAYERLRVAARFAEADSAWEVAREAYARMLAIAHRLDEPDRRRFEALQAIERLLEYMGRRPEWIDTIERLTVIADRVGDPAMRAEAALKRMAMLSVQGDGAGATASFERADALFDALGDAGSRARGYREVAYLAWLRGDYRQVIVSSFAAMAIDLALGHRRALAATAENVSHAYRWLDDDEEAERWAEQAAAIYEELGDLLASYLRLDIRAWLHLRRGDETAAAAVLEDLLPICVRLEDKHLVVEKHMTLGKVYLRARRYRRALDNFEAATRQGAATGDLRHEGYPRVSAGVALEGLGAFEEAGRSYLTAARLLGASYAMTGMVEDEVGQGDALVLHGGLARRRLGRPEAAVPSLRSAEAIFGRSGDANRLGLVQMELGALHWGTGDLELAAASYRTALETSSRAGMRERAIAARASLGVVYRDLGRLDESIAAAREAVDQVRAVDDPLGEAFLLTSLASSYQRAGRAGEARACLERSLVLRRDWGDDEGAAATIEALEALADVAVGPSTSSVA